MVFPGHAGFLHISWTDHLNISDRFLKDSLLHFFFVSSLKLSLPNVCGFPKALGFSPNFLTWPPHCKWKILDWDIISHDSNPLLSDTLLKVGGFLLALLCPPPFLYWPPWCSWKNIIWITSIQFIYLINKTIYWDKKTPNSSSVWWFRLKK